MGFLEMGIPQARWMIYFMEDPSIDGWELGVSLFQETPKRDYFFVNNTNQLWPTSFFGQTHIEFLEMIIYPFQ